MRGNSGPCGINADLDRTEWEGCSWKYIASAVGTSSNRSLCTDKEVHMLGVVRLAERFAHTY
jgi:hypothetical protein